MVVPGWVAVVAVLGLAAMAFGFLILDRVPGHWFYSRRAWEADRPVLPGDRPPGAPGRVPAGERMWVSPTTVVWLSEEEARRVEGKLLGREPRELEDGESDR
jgi:hypothetical protein